MQSDSSESESDGSIDYPDGNEVLWSESEEEEFHRREASHVQYRHYVVPTRKKAVRWEPFVKKVIIRWNEECAICLEKYSDPLVYCSRGCGHVFHEQCIASILSKNDICKSRRAKCPLCRREDLFVEVRMPITCEKQCV